MVSPRRKRWPVLLVCQAAPYDRCEGQRGRFRSRRVRFMADGGLQVSSGDSCHRSQSSEKTELSI